MSETSEKSKFSPKSIARDHDSTNESGVLGKSLPAVALQFSLGDQPATMEEGEKKSTNSVNYQSAGGSSAPPPSSLNHIGNSSNSGSNSSVQLKASYPSVPAVQFKTSLSQIKGIEAPAFQFKAEQPIQRKGTGVIQKQEEEGGLLSGLYNNGVGDFFRNNTFGSAISNNALGGLIGEVANSGVGGNLVSRMANGLSSISGRESAGVMDRIMNGGAETTVESARRMEQLETGVGARMGLAERATSLGRYLPLLGLYTDSSGVYDNMMGTGSAQGAGMAERLYNGVGSGLGLTSSVIGSTALLGSGATAAGGSSLLAGTSLGTGLSSAGAGIAGLVGEGTALGAIGAGAGTASALLASGALGYAAGRQMDNGVDWIGDQITGNEAGDHSISGLAADGMTSIDQSIARARGYGDDEAYRHTAGWWLAENLPSWMQ